MEERNIFDIVNSINKSLMEETEKPVVEEVPAEEDDIEPKVQITLPAEGGLEIETTDKAIVEEPDGTMRIAIAEEATDSDVLKLLEDEEPEKTVPDNKGKPCPRCGFYPCRCNGERVKDETRKLPDVARFQKLAEKNGQVQFKDLKDFDPNMIEDKKEELKVDEATTDETPVVEETKTFKKVLPTRNLYEHKLFKSHTNTFLSQYLPESLEFKASDVATLNESEKSEIMRGIAHSIIDAISDKLAAVDTSAADRSRGDIKNLKELPEIQTAITQLETILERSGLVIPDAKEYLGTVIKSILYLNQYNKVFKDAYRTKKTLLILRYQSLILAVISSISYLISALLDFADDNVGLKKIVKVEEIAPLKTLADFNRSVESGEFKIIVNDVTVLREYYNEYSVEDMNKLYEATDIISLITGGIKTLYSDLESSDKLTSMLYKATGIVVLLISIRDLIYTIARMKSKSSDMIDLISRFANINNGGLLKDLGKTTATFKADAESASEMTNSEVKSENRKLATEIKAAQAAPVITGRPDRPVIPPAEDIFSIDF